MISKASDTTCQLVAIRPEESMTKPEPTAILYGDADWPALTSAWSVAAVPAIRTVMLTTLGMRPRISSAQEVGTISLADAGPASSAATSTAPAKDAHPHHHLVHSFR